MKKIFSVMGPHAGETSEDIFERKIEDVKNTGITFWCIRSYKSKPMDVQEFCKSETVEVLFISPSSSGAAKDTKIDTENTEYSIDNTNWINIPSNITPVTGKGWALVLDKLEISNLEINLNKYAESKNNVPLKFGLGCSTICAVEEDMSLNENRVKSYMRKIWAVGRLKHPYCVWIR
tara:strand:+ start:334 stop:864 length:531 start_codon:yes stop_codon:yes gene_type:complete